MPAWKRSILALLAHVMMVASGGPRGPGRPPLGNDPQTLLVHERRREIIAILEARPGISVLELKQLSGMGGGALDNHLSRLREAGLVEERVSGHFTLLFPAGRAPDHDDPVLLPAPAKLVARYIVRNPGATGAEVVEGVGFSRSHVLAQVQRLVEASHVEAVREGRSIRYHPSPRLIAAMRLWSESRP